MKTPIVTFKAFDIVVVPFPFTDRTAAKRRPALVVSDSAAFNAKVGHSVLAMITSAGHSNWPLDTGITNLPAAGLATNSVVRMKLFTLDHRLIIRKAGALAAADRNAVVQATRKLLRACL